jgi:hypothetical protein
MTIYRFVNLFLVGAALAGAQGVPMKQAYLRFYEELNDYLPEDKRKRSFVCRFEGEVTVAILLGAIGVPLSEVDLLLCSGESVSPAHVVCDGDHISVYPVFESLDIRGTARVREEPLRRPCFVAGPDLVRLAAYLRMLGFDTRSSAGGSPDDCVRMAEAEKRILLTRDCGRQSKASRVYRVCSDKPRQQAAEVLARLDLYRLIAPLGRCPRCNAQLAETGCFMHCAACGMTRQHGVHLRRMKRLITRLSRGGGGN